MDSDMYRIKVLNHLNPHLIWVEVIDKADEIVFEQIGIYGILPMDTVLAVDDTIKSKRSDKWLQAASVVMTNTLADADEIWFFPIHIDRRSSLFNNNIHKYGDIVVKKLDGSKKHMSKQLKRSGFAVCDVPEFHRELSLGGIQTKLTDVEARSVIKLLRDHYINTHGSLAWDNWLKKQPYIYHIIQKIDIITELNMHNGETTRKQRNRLQEIQNKLNDLNLCSEVDEESVGRGKLRNTHKSPPFKLKLLTWKMRTAEEKLNYDDTSSVTDSTEPESDFNISKKTQNSFLKNSVNSDTSLDESLVEVEKSYIKNNKMETKKNLEKKIESMINETKKYAQISMQAQKQMREEPLMPTRLAYGPPGLELRKLAMKVAPRLQELAKTNIEQIEDAHGNIEIVIKDESSENNDNKKPSTDNKQSEDCKPKMKSSKSLLLQRKLKQHKEKWATQIETPTSGNVFEEPIQNPKVNEVSSDDESITGLIERLNLKNTTKCVPKKEVDRHDVVFREMPKINANPFRNLDGNNSVFVDKLISTVLMVHTKKNNRIQPCSNIRDVPFTPEIHLVLRNMGVKAPTRVQTVSWTTILRGHSVFMVGPLGCGKTIGYLPAVCRLTSDYRKQNPDNVYPTTIIVCATAKSVSEVEKYSKMLFGLDERVLACYAGMDELSMTTSLLNGCDLLICTPPILARLLQTELGVNLRALTTFVIDDCERIAEVYSDEIKLALYEIKKVLKSRANKEIKVQFVVASRVWCKFLESLAKKVPDTVVCIGSFQECVLYSQTRMLVDFVKEDNKINAVLEFLEDVQGPKRTVIVCRHDDEVQLLENTLTKLNRVVFACNNAMTIHDLYNLNIAWGKYEEPIRGPILVCCDGNLVHLNITDAHYLLHYSMPSLFSTFAKRFSVLNDNFPSIFTNNDQKLKVKILLEDTNAEQLPKILNFVKRCTDNVPAALNDVANEILARRDARKAEDLVPICDTMLSFGQCADFWNCRERHAVFKDYDKPKEWMPTDGHINFKILHYHSVDLYSARLLSNTVKGNTNKYPQTIGTLSMKMGMYFSKESNRRLHGIPRLGDVCAVSVKQDFYARCQVVKILDNYKNGNPKHMLVRLIDEEKYERTKDIHLYYLPDEMKEVQTYVVQVRLANIRPQDKDVTYSELAKNQLKRITDTEEDLYMRGHIVLVIGNCVFVDTLEACQDFTTLSGTVVRYNFKQELLNGHAECNPDHIPTLEKLCKELISEDVTLPEVEMPKQLKILPKCHWAHLDSDDMSAVFLSSAEDPDKFFVRLAKFRECLNLLIKDINAYCKENPEPVETINKDDIVLAKFPDDSMYERARIDDIYGDKVKCFFVDQGDWRDVYRKHLVPITAKFITQMPFQAIECRLIGVTPPGDAWTDFCTNWFYDYCFEDGSGNIKQLFVKYFDKTKAESTDGHKYGVAIIDTTSEEDIIVNHLMVDLNLAKVNEDEIKYLENLKFTDTSQQVSDSDSYVDEPKNAVTPFQMMQAPLRSVPLVDSDNESDDLDKWAFNMTDDFMSMVKPNVALKALEEGSGTTDNNLVKNDIENIDETADEGMAIVPLNNSAMTSDSTSNQEKDNLVIAPELKNKQMSIADLRNEKVIENFEDTQYRKPKLTWYQNKNSVIVKIHLIGADDYILNIVDRYLKFYVEHNDTTYGFQLELYGAVDVPNSNHSNKGQYILVKLMKILQKNWLTLTRDGSVRKWILYDLERIDTSSSDEENDNSNLLDAIKNIHEQDETDTEDEDFADDVTYRNPRYV